MYSQNFFYPVIKPSWGNMNMKKNMNKNMKKKSVQLKHFVEINTIL